MSMLSPFIMGSIIHSSQAVFIYLGLVFRSLSTGQDFVEGLQHMGTYDCSGDEACKSLQAYSYIQVLRCLSVIN